MSCGRGSAHDFPMKKTTQSLSWLPMYVPMTRSYETVCENTTLVLRWSIPFENASIISKQPIDF